MDSGVGAGRENKVVREKTLPLLKQGKGPWSLLVILVLELWVRPLYLLYMSDHEGLGLCPYQLLGQRVWESGEREWLMKRSLGAHDMCSPLSKPSSLIWRGLWVITVFPFVCNFLYDGEDSGCSLCSPLSLPSCINCWNTQVVWEREKNRMR